MATQLSFNLESNRHIALSLEEAKELYAKLREVFDDNHSDSCNKVVPEQESFETYYWTV